MPVLRHQRIRVAAQFESVQRSVNIRPAAQQRGGKAAVHLHDGTGHGLFTDLQVRGDLMARRSVGRQDPLNQQLKPATAGFLTEQPRFDDLGVIEHQQVAGQEQAGQVGELAIGQCRCAGIQQTRAAAQCRRVLGNQFWREREIKITEGKSCLHTGTIVPCHPL